MIKSTFSIEFLVTTLLLSYGCAPVSVTTSPSKSGPLPAKAVVKTLSWKPTLSRSDLGTEPLSAYSSLCFTLRSVRDAREDVRIIGKTFEDLKVRDVVIPIATRENVEKWFHSALMKSFQVLTVKADVKKGDLGLEIEIRGFSLLDDFTQTGTISLHVAAFTKDDMLIWEGQVRGTSDLYVHSTDSDGVSECLSNTVLVTLQNALVEQSFLDAVKKTFE